MDSVLVPSQQPEDAGFQKLKFHGGTGAPFICHSTSDRYPRNVSPLLTPYAVRVAPKSTLMLGSLNPKPLNLNPNHQSDTLPGEQGKAYTGMQILRTSLWRSYGLGIAGFGGSGFRVSGLGFRVQGIAFRV